MRSPGAPQRDRREGRDQMLAEAARSIHLRTADSLINVDKVRNVESMVSSDHPIGTGAHMRGSTVFHDSYWYCYANCTAMLLSSVGEQISPRLIEALSAVGLGASMIPHGLIFFGELTSPDKGISQALGLLGFTFEEAAAETPDRAPYDRLQELLDEGPAVLGRLDMVHLSYNPMRPRHPGVDHYVLAYEMTGDKIYLHDPAGFAHVFIDREQLTQAWKAEAVGYRCGYYRYWAAPRRSARLSAEKTYDHAIGVFQRLYKQAEQRAATGNRLIGRDALLALADIVERGFLGDSQRDHLIYFALPLGAKRALDYAVVFAGHHDLLRQLKQDQAEEFGRCLASVVVSNWNDAGRSLRNVAKIEASIKTEILSIGVGTR